MVTETSVAYFPGPSIDENTEIVRKHHVDFRSYYVGKEVRVMIFPCLTKAALPSLRGRLPVERIGAGTLPGEPDCRCPWGNAHDRLPSRPGGAGHPRLTGGRGGTARARAGGIWTRHLSSRSTREAQEMAGPGVWESAD